MTKEELFSLFDSTLKIINNQSLQNPQYKHRVEHLNQRVADKLLLMSSAEEMDKMHKIIFESHQISFEPKITENLPEISMTVGLIENGNEKVLVERQLVGRLCGGVADGSVVCVEYFKPIKEDDPELFKLAEIHKGISGVEGVVKRKVPIRQAATLMFTGTV